MQTKLLSIKRNYEYKEKLVISCSLCGCMALIQGARYEQRV